MSQTTTVGINGTTSSHSLTNTSTPTTIRSTNASIGPLLKLARVEIQAIMQFLPRVDLLCFSRCSRTLLADGDSDTAWKFQPIYELTFSHLLPVCLRVCDLTTKFRPSLFLRRQPGFGLRGRLEPYTFKLQFLLTLLEFIPRLKRLTFLNDSYVKPDEWCQILAHSALDELIEFHVQCNCFEMSTSAFLSLLQRLTQLEAFTLPRGLKYDTVIGLVAFSQLHYLNVTQDARPLNDEVAMSTDIMNTCQHLTSLHMTRPFMTSDRFRTVFSSPNFVQLRELSLSQWFDPGSTHGTIDASVTLDILHATWKEMTNLKRLRLDEIHYVNFILPTLASGGFRELILTFPAHVVRVCVPEPERLSELLVHAPNLRIIVSTDSGKHGRPLLHSRYRSIEQVSHPTRFYLILHPNLRAYQEWKPPPLLPDP